MGYLASLQRTVLSSRIIGLSSYVSLFASFFGFSFFSCVKLFMPSRVKQYNTARHLVTPSLITGTFRASPFER